jgi:hypothetical protein
MVLRVAHDSARPTAITRDIHRLNRLRTETLFSRKFPDPNLGD